MQQKINDTTIWLQRKTLSRKPIGGLLITTNKRIYKVEWKYINTKISPILVWSHSTRLTQSLEAPTQLDSSTREFI